LGGVDDRASSQETFGISGGTLKRLLVRRRTTTNLRAHSPPGRPRYIGAAQQALLWAQLEAYPDATLDEHARRWNMTHSMTLSARTLGRAIARLGWTRKKRRWQLPNATSTTGSTGASA
jgi:transposase